MSAGLFGSWGISIADRLRAQTIGVCNSEKHADDNAVDDVLPSQQDQIFRERTQLQEQSRIQQTLP